MDSPGLVAPDDQEIFAARSLDGRVVAVGITDELEDIDAAVWTLEGDDWARVSPESLAAPDHQVMLDVAGGGGGLPLVAVGCEDPDYRCDTQHATDPDAAVWASEDGSSWVRVSEGGRMSGPGDQAMRALVTSQGALIAVGSHGGPGGDIDGGVWISADGIVWSAPTQSSPDVTALGGQGDQSLRALVVYRRHGITLFGFGVTQEDDAVDGRVWSAQLGG